VVEPRKALQVLLDLTRALSNERSLSAALKCVTDAALNLLPGDHASIRVLDQRRTELLSGARSGAGLGKRPVKHEPGRGVAGWVVDHGEVARIDDTAEDDRFVRKANQGFEIRSMLAVPLWSAGEVVGVLAVTSREAGTFSEEEEALVSLLANCAVPPIEKARLARLAVTDAQTMAFNQSYLMPAMEHEMVKYKGAPGSLSMLMIDLDHFKKVNDTYGHAAGDIVLRIFADRVRGTTREADVVVRRGGDEFVLIMPGTGRDHALAVAQRIHRIMSNEPVQLQGSNAVTQTVSIGVATWTGRENPEDFEKRADAAMYQAKMAGRDRVHVAPRPPGAPEPSQPGDDQPADDRPGLEAPTRDTRPGEPEPGEAEARVPSTRRTVE
jgi:diguanylate cyclase (GGDEF)-like protein